MPKLPPPRGEAAKAQESWQALGGSGRRVAGGAPEKAANAKQKAGDWRLRRPRLARPGAWGCLGLVAHPCPVSIRSSRPLLGNDQWHQLRPEPPARKGRSPGHLPEDTLLPWVLSTAGPLLVHLPPPGCPYLPGCFVAPQEAPTQGGSGVASLRDGQRLGVWEVNLVTCREGGSPQAPSSPELRRTLEEPQRKRDPMRSHLASLSGGGRWRCQRPGAGAHRLQTVLSASVLSPSWGWGGAGGRHALEEELFCLREARRAAWRRRHLSWVLNEE